MNYKPSDFFFGVIDLFVILLPGMIATFILLYTFTGYPVERLPQLSWGTTGQIAAFLMSSYVFGHFVSFGGTLVDRVFKERDVSKIKSDNSALRKASKGFAQAIYGTTLVEGMSLRRLAVAYVRTRSDVGAISIDRKDADRRFFRNITFVFFSGVIALAGRGVAALAADPLGRGAKEPFVVAGVSLVLFLLSLWRSRYQQDKFTETVFEHFVAINSGAPEIGEKNGSE